jgi:hypothetical protein
MLGGNAVMTMDAGWFAKGEKWERWTGLRLDWTGLTMAAIYQFRRLRSRDQRGPQEHNVIGV